MCLYYLHLFSTTDAIFLWAIRRNWLCPRAKGCRFSRCRCIIISRRFSRRSRKWSAILQVVMVVMILESVLHSKKVRMNFLFLLCLVCCPHWEFQLCSIVMLRGRALIISPHIDGYICVDILGAPVVYNDEYSSLSMPVWQKKPFWR